MQDPIPKRGGVRYLTIDADQSGQRIDNFLLAQLRRVPKSHVYRILRTGQVRVNGGRVKATYRLQTEDKVRVPPIHESEPDNITVPDAIVRLLEQSVVYEDERLLAINKPPGLAVHAGSGLHYGIIDAFRQSRKASGTRLELVHRLDRGTSGCLIIGKSRRATQKLQDLFRDDRVGKRYLGLTAGQWQVDNLTINKPLRKNQVSGGERSVHIDANGKSALSHFTLRELFSADSEHEGMSASLMDIIIETGRTHQIRVHAASEGHAIVGDEKYGGSQINRQFRQLGLKRLYLHCNEMTLDVDDGLSLIVPPDSHWENELDRLRNTSSPRTSR